MDLLFVMGSDLAEQPVCVLPDEAGATCHRVLVDKTCAGDFDLFGRQRRRMKLESKAFSNSVQSDIMQKQLQARLKRLEAMKKSMADMINQADRIVQHTSGTNK